MERKIASLLDGRLSAEGLVISCCTMDGEA